MQLKDIHQELSEAPEEFGAKQGLSKRIGTKIRKKLDPRKDKRAAAETEDQYRTQAKQLKTQFAKYMASQPRGTEPTIDHVEAFFSDTEYEQYVSNIAIKLNMKEPTEAPSQDQDETPADDDSADSTTDEVGGDEQEDLISPEAMTGEPQKRELTPDDQAGFDKINKAAKEEGEEYEKQDLSASKGDDKEPKIDTSASIYEARLHNMLTELRDNEIDTLLYRIVQAQAAAKGGPPKEEPQSPLSTDIKKQAAAQEKDPAKKRDVPKSLLKRDIRDIFKNSNVDDDGDEGGSYEGGASDDFLGEYQDELVSVLTKVKNGDDLDKRDKSNAGKMLYSLD